MHELNYDVASMDVFDLFQFLVKIIYCLGTEKRILITKVGNDNLRYVAYDGVTDKCSTYIATDLDSVVNSLFICGIITAQEQQMIFPGLDLDIYSNQFNLTIRSYNIGIVEKLDAQLKLVLPSFVNTAHVSAEVARIVQDCYFKLEKGHTI